MTSTFLRAGAVDSLQSKDQNGSTRHLWLSASDPILRSNQSESHVSVHRAWQLPTEAVDRV
jgi:hypothetical protein